MNSNYVIWCVSTKFCALGNRPWCSHHTVLEADWRSTWCLICEGEGMKAGIKSAWSRALAELRASTHSRRQPCSLTKTNLVLGGRTHHIWAPSLPSHPVLHPVPPALGEGCSCREPGGGGCRSTGKEGARTRSGCTAPHGEGRGLQRQR